MIEHHEKLENMYLLAPINELYKPSIKVSEAKVEISIEVNPQFFHAAGAIHGSVYFKMLDDAAFFAANSLVDDVFVLTVGFETKLLQPVFEGVLKAEGKVVNVAGNKIFAEAEVYNNNKLVGTGKGVFFRSSLKLNEISSYKIL